MIKVGDVYRKEVPMRPFPKARPRVTRNGTFMPAKYQEQRDELALFCADMPDFSNHLIWLSVTSVRRMPKSWSAKRRDMMRGEWCTTGPDADNAAGAVMDALFEDDSCVVALVSQKLWGDDDAILIRARVIGDDPVPF